MSILPRCTCDYFGYGMGMYSERCPRHWSSAKWWKEIEDRRAAEAIALREQAKTRPVHGGYPQPQTDSPPSGA